MTKYVTISTTLSLSEDRIDEAARDLDLLNDPFNLITFNDGYYAKSLRDKWGMSTSDLAKLVREGKRQRKQTKRD